MSKIVRISESEIVRLVKKIVKEQKYTAGRKPIKEDEDEQRDREKIQREGERLSPGCYMQASLYENLQSVTYHA